MSRYYTFRLFKGNYTTFAYDHLLDESQAKVSDKGQIVALVNEAVTTYSADQILVLKVDPSEGWDSALFKWDDGLHKFTLVDTWFTEW